MPDMVRIAITPGEPAGIGPELVLKLAQHTLKFEIIAIANVKMLQQQAEQLQAIQGAASAAKDLGSASTEDGTALGDLVGG